MKPIRIVCSSIAGALLLLPAIPAAQDTAVSGTVFVDANGNGLRDRGEQGLANVAVSNQDAVVTTDAAGAYRVPRGTTGVVFVSVPDGYRAVGSFWKRSDDTAVATADFPFVPVTRTGDFTFVHASDTHISPASVVRTQRFQAL